MSNAGLNYAMMTDCERVGIGGGCGPDCCVYQDGDCEYEDEFEEKYGIAVVVEDHIDDYNRAMKGVI